MIGIIEIDEKDVSDDRHIILELPIEPERNGVQTVMRVKTNIKLQPEPCEDADKLKRCRFEYINACKIAARSTPDTSKNDIYDAHAVIKALYPIFGDEEF